MDSEHLYWANSAIESIGRADIDGTNVENDFIKAPKTEELDPNDVAVDQNHIYWTNSLTEWTIGRANLNGHAIEEEFITGVGVAWELDIDFEHIYWANREAGKPAIGRADIDGTGVDPAFIPLVAEPLGIVVDGVHVFWTNDETLGRIGRAEIGGGGVEEAFIPGPLGSFIGSITAEVTPIVAASPVSLTFGSDTPVPQNSISRPQTVTYTNEGNEPLTISGFTLTGSNADDFLTGTDTCRQTIAPGASCTLQIRFAPQASGSASAVLTALTNAPENPVTALNGIASAPTGRRPGRSGGSRRSHRPARPQGPRRQERQGHLQGEEERRQDQGHLQGEAGEAEEQRQRRLATHPSTANGRPRGRPRRNGRIRLDLPGANRLPPGRYVLHLAGQRHGTAFVVR